MRGWPKAIKFGTVIALLAAAAGGAATLTRATVFRPSPAAQGLAAPPAVGVVATTVKRGDVPI